MLVQTTFPIDPMTKMRLLRKAYTTEFAGNIIEVSRDAAEAWARDYPEVFAEYLDKHRGVAQW